jgi:hypothetical protein
MAPKVMVNIMCVALHPIQFRRFLIVENNFKYKTLFFSQIKVIKKKLFFEMIS